jgi:hypothetical protein
MSTVDGYAMTLRMYASFKVCEDYVTDGGGMGVGAQNTAAVLGFSL